MSSSNDAAEISSASWQVEVFFDGACPLCRREIAMLRRRDHHGRIRFTDIAAPTFHDDSLPLGHDELMARIHGRLPDGKIIQGVEVFRRLYGAVGWSWLVAVTRWPLISPALDLAYRLFARHRLKLTGRCTDGVCRAN